jgi:hypothetical protein
MGRKRLTILKGLLPEILFVQSIALAFVQWACADGGKNTETSKVFLNIFYFSAEFAQSSLDFSTPREVLLIFLTNTLKVNKKASICVFCLPCISTASLHNSQCPYFYGHYYSHLQLMHMITKYTHDT